MKIGGGGKDSGSDDNDDDDEERPSDCKANILKKYPDAECLKTADKEECRGTCEEKGNKKCGGNQGEIHKLNCKGEEPDSNGQVSRSRYSVQVSYESSSFNAGEI